MDHFSEPAVMPIASPAAGEGHQRTRTRRLLEGAASTTLSKGAILLVSVVSIPITIRYLGAEKVGVWVTVSTVLAMLLVLDLGVANSLTNFISEAYAREDRNHASTYVTTAFGIMVAFACLLGLGGWALYPHLQWASLFHLNGRISPVEVGHAVAAAFIVFLVGLPVSLAPKILGGYQELKVASFFQAGGSIANLLSLVVLIHLHAGLVAMVAASAAALVVANAICLAWISLFHKPWLRPKRVHFSSGAARRMMSSGSEFFIIQIAALVVFNSDNLVVTHFLGPREVASYSVAWRLVGYATVAQTLVTPALWPAFSEAFNRGDFVWVRRTFARIMWITMLIALLFCVICAFAGRWIIQIWASRSAVPTEGLLLLMCGWVLLSTFVNNTSTVLLSKGEVRLQAWASLAAAALNLVLSIYWVQRIGAPGVILGTIVSYLALLVVPQTWKAWQVLYGRDAGREAVVPHETTGA